MGRSYGHVTLMNHKEAVHYFRELLADLQKGQLGIDHEPITEERLKEGWKYLFEIQACERPARIW
jgi:hypothetical protein